MISAVSSYDGQDVRRTRKERPDPSIRKRHPVLYDGHLVRRGIFGGMAQVSNGLLNQQPLAK
jgi:hypothetical protein